MQIEHNEIQRPSFIFCFSILSGYCISIEDESGIILYANFFKSPLLAVQALLCPSIEMEPQDWQELFTSILSLGKTLPEAKWRPYKCAADWLWKECMPLSDADPI